MIAPQGGARDEFKVTTPAEAGIAFLDGPRIGGYGAEPEEHEQPTPTPEPARASPRPEAPRVESPTPPQVESPAPLREETPEERERRLRASKTEIVEVGKAEGAPARGGWWRRGG